MKRRLISLRAIMIVAGALLFAAQSTSRGLAAETSVPYALQIPSSGIQIDKIDFTNDGTYPTIWYECISFTNLGPRPATWVLFDFSWVQPGDADENDEFDLASATAPNAGGTGTFAPGVQTGLVRGRAIGFCRMVLREWNGAKPTASLVTFVAAVQYQDGTSWYLLPTIDGMALNPQGAPARIVTVKSSGSSEPRECATIENTANKPIQHVRITFRHSGLDGSVLSDDALDVRAAIPSGSVVKNNCRNYSGVLVPGLRAYADAQLQGTAPPVPQIKYKNQISTLSAFVDEVDFADETKWQPSSP